MAFAQLVFSSTPLAGQVMKAIAKVLTGEKNIDNLEGVLKTPIFDPLGYGLGSYKTEIVNPNSEAWEIVFPSSIPPANNFALEAFTIRSACVVNTKYKYVRFILTDSVDAFSEPTGSLTTFSKTTSYFMHAHGVSGVDASGVVSDQTYRVTNGTFANIRKGTSTSEPYVVWLSWSNRHLFVLSSVNNGNNIGRNCFYGAFEFAENTLSQLKNGIPCVHLKGHGDNTTLLDVTTNGTAVGNTAQILKSYSGQNFSIVSIRSLASTTNSTSTLSSSAFQGVQWNNNIGLFTSSTFQNQIQKWQVVPIIVNDVAGGYGYINLSEYSNIWIFLNAGLEHAIWQDSNGVKYKSLNIFNNATTNFSSILVKYG